MGSTYAGMFLLAGSVLLLEISLTRVLAIMMWNHFTYLVVSLALLGFGAAGSILTTQRQGLRTDPPAGQLAGLSVAYGASVIVALLLATRVPVDSLALWHIKVNLLWLGLLCVLLFVPFLLGGAAIGLALARLATHVNRLYFADLVGSAVGGALAVWLLGRVGNVATVVVAGATGVLAGACFAWGAGRQTFRWTIPAVVLAAAVAWGFCGGPPALGIPGLSWTVPFAPGKELTLLDERYGVERLPSATAEVEVGPSLASIPILGGDFGVVDRQMVQARVVGQDGTAPTMLFEDAAELDRYPILDDTQAASAYVAYAARGGTRPRVLVIGVGGGVDVMIALHHEAEQVTAVEINAAMIDMVTRRFADYIGGLFDPATSPATRRVALHHAEGRSWVRGHPDRYDIIQLSGVDSFTALSTGANALAESHLYTIEAVQDLYDRLTPGGYINYSRFIMSPPRKPRETMRLANIAVTALTELGVPDAASQIAVFHGAAWASTMIKRGAFTPVEIQALETFAEAEGFWGMVFDPLHRPGTPFPPSALRLATAGHVVTGFLERGRHLPADTARSEPARRELAALVRSALRGQPHAATAPTQLAADLGLPDPGPVTAFVDDAVRWSRMLDRPFHQMRRNFETLLRGTPAERDAFVHAYDYDVTPVTDDRPFFFDYYRYRGILDAWEPSTGARATLDKYHPDYPVGHLVLVVSQVQILILAAVLILLPLRVLEHAGVPTPGRWHIFGYFAALGLGFMAVELSLMQRLVLFLGHPTHAMTVVLASLLAAAGVGSLLGERIVTLGRPTLGRLLGAVLLVILGSALVVGRVLPALLGWPFPGRVLATIAVLTPLGLVLGMPFPTGLRIVKARCPQLLPWAWGINGFLSVLASLLTVTLSMALGYSTVLLLAAAVYAAGFLALIAYVRPSASIGQ